MLKCTECYLQVVLCCPSEMMQTFSWSPESDLLWHRCIHTSQVDRLISMSMHCICAVWPQWAWPWPWALTSFCSKLQNHPQHIQFNLKYHHLMFCVEKMATYLILPCPWPFDLNIQSVHLCPKCTKAVNLVNFSKHFTRRHVHKLHK